MYLFRNRYISIFYVDTFRTQELLLPVTLEASPGPDGLIHWWTLNKASVLCGPLNLGEGLDPAGDHPPYPRSSLHGSSAPLAPQVYSLLPPSQMKFLPASVRLCESVLHDQSFSLHVSSSTFVKKS